MKYEVLKQMARRSENMKVYLVGSDIELNKEDAAPLIKYEFIKPKRNAKTKK